MMFPIDRMLYRPTPYRSRLFLDPSSRPRQPVSIPLGIPLPSVHSSLPRPEFPPVSENYLDVPPNVQSYDNAPVLSAAPRQAPEEETDVTRIKSKAGEFRVTSSNLNGCTYFNYYWDDKKTKDCPCPYHSQQGRPHKVERKFPDYSNIAYMRTVAANRYYHPYSERNIENDKPIRQDVQPSQNNPVLIRDFECVQPSPLNPPDNKPFLQNPTIVCQSETHPSIPKPRNEVKNTIVKRLTDTELIKIARSFGDLRLRFPKATMKHGVWCRYECCEEKPVITLSDSQEWKSNRENYWQESAESAPSRTRSSSDVYSSDKKGLVKNSRTTRVSRIKYGHSSPPSSERAFWESSEKANSYCKVSSTKSERTPSLELSRDTTYFETDSRKNKTKIKDSVGSKSDNPRWRENDEVPKEKTINTNEAMGNRKVTKEKTTWRQYSSQQRKENESTVRGNSEVSSPRKIKKKAKSKQRQSFESSSEVDIKKGGEKRNAPQQNSDSRTSPTKNEAENSDNTRNASSNSDQDLKKECTSSDQTESEPQHHENGDSSKVHTPGKIPEREEHVGPSGDELNDKIKLLKTIRVISEVLEKKAMQGSVEFPDLTELSNTTLHAVMMELVCLLSSKTGKSKQSGSAEEKSPATKTDRNESFAETSAALIKDSEQTQRDEQMNTSDDFTSTSLLGKAQEKITDCPKLTSPPKIDLADNVAIENPRFLEDIDHLSEFYPCLSFLDEIDEHDFTDIVSSSDYMRDVYESLLKAQSIVAQGIESLPSVVSPPANGKSHSAATQDEEPTSGAIFPETESSFKKNSSLQKIRKEKPKFHASIKEDFRGNSTEEQPASAQGGDESKYEIPDKFRDSYLSYMPLKRRDLWPGLFSYNEYDANDTPSDVQQKENPESSPADKTA